MRATLPYALEGMDAIDRIRAIRATLPGDIVFTTSFGLEDQVLTHLIAESGADIRIATLDTGRLFPETYLLWAETEERYAIRIAAYSPLHEALQGYSAERGINGFYRSIEARKACCNIRKVEPLGRALQGAAGWITGLRADQSPARAETAFVEQNTQFGLLKLNPLLDWSREHALTFAKKHRVPVNPLHEQGFLSIGCAPCTRAIEPGEPERAGRWWWEDEARKECGLHVGPDGRVVPPAREEIRP
jgi:phosphoadenosine phosphosulfate reductase